MISVKGGTQTWSNSAQQSAQKGDGSRNVSATDQQKYFDAESVGDTANKVADPNYVDSSKKMRAVGNAELGKDAFMSLLLTQMKNQDPTNPLKSHEMAAQLAQFTSLEKLNNINEGIGALRKDNAPDHNFQALQFIGKSVNMDNSKIMRTEEKETHDLRFSLPQDSQKANIEIKDAAGNVIRKMEMKALKAGPNSIVWNGKTEEGATAPKGDYTLNVEAIGSNGHKLAVQTKADGIITGVNFTANGAQLLMGKQVISLADVKSISDPNIGKEAQMMTALANSMQMPQQGPGAGSIPGAAAAMAQQRQRAAQQQNPAAAQQAAPQGHMIPIGDAIRSADQPKPGDLGQPEEASVPHGKMEVKPEARGNEAKRARLSKGSVNDASMSQGLINHINKEGVKAGMGT
ncbi:MAG: flagellar hook assembly protein FlgD [Bdellovibrionales bacterium]